MNDGPTMTLSFTGGDRLAIKTLADRETGGNASAAIRLAVRQALAQAEPNPYGERYDALMRAQYRQLRRLITEGELRIIAVVHQGWLVTPADITMIWAEVEDWEPDPRDMTVPAMSAPQRAAFIARLRALTDVQCHALIYALDDARRRIAATGQGVAWEEVLGGRLAAMV